MNTKCNVIRDLLPLYIDEVVSDESRQLIEDHLKECPECRAYLDELRAGLPALENDENAAEYAQEARVLRRIKRKMIMRNSILVLMVAILVGAAVWGIHGFFNSDEPAPISMSLKYDLPEGYTIMDSDDPDDLSFKRETDEFTETIRIYGSSHGIPSGDDNIKIDENTIIEHWKDEEDEDFRPHGYSDDYYLAIFHKNTEYSLYYKCRVKGRENYFDSYRPEGRAEILEFAKSFRFDDSIRQEPMSFKEIIRDPYAIASIVIMALTVIVFLGMPIAMAIGGIMVSRDERKGEKDSTGQTAAGSGISNRSDAPISSRDLHADMNRERQSKGDSSLPPINTAQGVSTNTLARKDKSWSSVPDFFIKMFRRK